jgi:hypothetical protein
MHKCGLKLDANLLTEQAAHRHANKYIVNVEAGATYRMLNDYLWPIDEREKTCQGYRTVLNMPGYEDLSLGGTIAVSAQGSGLMRHAVSDQVVAMHLVTFDKNDRVVQYLLEPRHPKETDHHVYDREKFEKRIDAISGKTRYFSGDVELIQDDSLFFSALVSLGAFGIVYSFVMRTQDAFYLHEKRTVQTFSTWKKMLPDLRRRERLDPKHPDALHSWELWTNPYKVAGHYWTNVSTYSYEWSRPKASLKKRRGAVDDSLSMVRHTLDLVMAIAKGKVPGIRIPTVLQISLLKTRDDVYLEGCRALSFGSYNASPVNVVAGMFDATHSQVLIFLFFFSFSFRFPLQYVIADLEATIEHINHLRRTQNLFVTSPISSRFTRPSNAYLAPQFGRPSHMIEAPILAATPGCRNILDDLVQFWLTRGARIHWGLRQQLTLPDLIGPSSRHSPVPRYPFFHRWIRAFEKFNPNGRFSNCFTESAGFDQFRLRTITKQALIEACGNPENPQDNFVYRRLVHYCKDATEDDRNNAKHRRFVSHVHVKSLSTFSGRSELSPPPLFRQLTPGPARGGLGTAWLDMRSFKDLGNGQNRLWCPQEPEIEPEHDQERELSHSANSSEAEAGLRRAGGKSRLLNDCEWNSLIVLWVLWVVWTVLSFLIMTGDAYSTFAGNGSLFPLTTALFAIYTVTVVVWSLWWAPRICCSPRYFRGRFNEARVHVAPCTRAFGGCMPCCPCLGRGGCKQNCRCNQICCINCTGLCLAVGFGIVMFILFILWGMLVSTVPQLDQTVSFPQLSSEAKVTWEPNGYVHIEAGNRYDAFFTQGVLHAQARPWGLEFAHRVGSGRLSQAAGPDANRQDRFFRSLNLLRVSERVWNNQSPTVREALQAYCDGINAWFDTKPRLSPEFVLLGVTPSVWTPVNVIAWSKVFGFFLGHNWDNELIRLDLLMKGLTPERINEIMPAYGTGSQNTVTHVPDELVSTFQQPPAGNSTPPTHLDPLYDTAAWRPPSSVLLEAQNSPQKVFEPVERFAGLSFVGKIGTLATGIASALWNGPTNPQTPLFGAFTFDWMPSDVGMLAGMGDLERLHADGSWNGNSNSWVIHGNHTQSGKPIVQNDPHTPHSSPGLWMQVDYNTPDYSPSGIGIIGLPAVAFGRNDDAMWTITSAGADTMDWYVLDETEDGLGYIWNGTRFEYEIYDEVIEANLFGIKSEDTIRIKWAPHCFVDFFCFLSFIF